MIEQWRTWAIVFIMTLCFVDLVMTYYYVYTYKNWQPNKPYKSIELNPILRFLWKTFGLHLGMFIGAVFILTLNYLVVRYAHWSIVLILFLVLSFTMYNHAHNTTLLYKLIEMYPSGSLPESIFGKVVGNN